MISRNNTKKEYANDKKQENSAWNYIGSVADLCSVLIYSVVTNLLVEHDIMLALAVTAGFIALGSDKEDSEKG